MFVFNTVAIIYTIHNVYTCCNINRTWFLNIRISTCFLQGVGTVISGTCMQGVIRLSDTLLLGPTSLGEFIPVPIRSIQRKRLPVSEVRGGQTASFALKKVVNT